MKTFSLAALAGICAVFGGCQKENQRLTIGPDLPLETFTPNYQNTGTAPIGDKPLTYKAANLENLGWREVDFPVPNDTVAHPPTYRTEYAKVSKTTRQRRETPTAESCLDLGEDTRNDQMYEAFVFTPAILVYDTITMPFRMVGYSGLQHTRYSPRFAYERDPTPDGTVGVLKTDASAAKCSNSGCTDACKCAPGNCTCNHGAK